MTSTNIVHCEIIANGLIEPTTLQFDEERNIIYALTNYKLTQIDLNKNENNIEIVRQRNRRFGETNKMEDDEDADEEDEYSQGESDDEDMNRVSNPDEDSEPSTGDDEETVENRRNWRRYGWRYYQLDNPCSILFLKENNKLIILNEGVITFLTIQYENQQYPFVEKPSKNIFCYDFQIFNQDNKQRSVQPWSITSTSIKNFFIFSLLEGSQLYSLDMTNETTLIEEYLTITIISCPYLLFHSQLNKIFVYDSSQILLISLDDKSIIKINLSFIQEGKSISTMTIDKIGHIYILSDSTIFKCILESTQLNLIEILGKIDISISYPQMITTNQQNQFYISDMEAGSIYQSKLISI